MRALFMRPSRKPWISSTIYGPTEAIPTTKTSPFAAESKDRSPAASSWLGPGSRALSRPVCETSCGATGLDFT